jgi:hypothetical protein
VPRSTRKRRRSARAPALRIEREQVRLVAQFGPAPDRRRDAVDGHEAAPTSHTAPEGVQSSGHRRWWTRVAPALCRALPVPFPWWLDDEGVGFGNPRDHRHP